MNIEEQLKAIQKSIEDLKMIFVKNQLDIISEKWIPWSDAKEFFDYVSTQMNVLEKNIVKRTG
jgi:hypothetical protein